MRLVEYVLAARLRDVISKSIGSGCWLLAARQLLCNTCDSPSRLL